MTDTVELPRYRAHNDVWALQIAAITPERYDLATDSFYTDLIPADVRYDPITVRRDWMQIHQPQAGGYYIQHPDGFSSFAPAETFEVAYTYTRQTEGTP